MKKNSVFVKTFACLFTASVVVGAFSYSTERFEPKKIDLSAFKNASANIQYLTQKPEEKEASATEDVTTGIVTTIEKEVKRKIYSTRVALKPSRPKIAKKKIEVAEVVAKNWNEIKPDFAAVDLKLDEPKIQILTIDESASEFEINNRELVNHYGFEVENLSYESFSNVELASYDVINDEVQVAQAATTTKIVEEITPETAEPVMTTQTLAVESKEDLKAAKIATTENPVNDELVVYDYSEKTEEKPVEKLTEKAAPTAKMKKMFDAPLSNSVKEAIERELQTSGFVVSTQAMRKAAPKNDEDQKVDLEKVMADEDAVVYDYSAHAQAATTKKEKSGESAFTAGLVDDVTTQVEYSIKAREINLSTQKTRASVGFEFVPDYDRAERLDDQTLGEIKVGYSLSNEMSTLTGVVEAQGMIPTRVEMSLKNGSLEVPLLNEASIQKFLQKKGLDIFGNLFMTAIDSSVADVEIDSEYQAKLYFSESFKIVSTHEAASYVLFLGVKNGNMLVRYLLDNKESAQKIVYVGEGEMYYEDPDFSESSRELFTFNTRSLLGKKVKELNINGSDISVYGTTVTAKKKTLNSYEIKIPSMVDNSRKYLEFKHMGSSLFVGTSKAKEMEIPGQDFIGRVMQANQLSELGERCMVQLNLTKELRDLKVSGKNRAGQMFAETSFLDNDGNFSRDNSELAEKIFITGDLEGIFGVRLDYTDGSTEFLKTYCSEGSYLIEQL